MKLKNLGLILLLFSFVGLEAQSVLNAKSPADLRRMREENLKLNAKGDTIKDESEPLPYGYINEDDILWSKVVWEVIDLNEKINQPYYNSTNGIAYKTLSLFDALKKGIEDGKITEVYDDEYFEYKITKDQAVNALSRTDTTDYYYEQKERGVDMSNAVDDGINRFDISSDKIKMIMVKGMWYVDRRIGEMRYRLLGLSVLGPDAQSIGRSFEGADDFVNLFWIWYPDARKVLHQYTVFDPKNASSKITYDDMLNARRFNSIIYKTSDAMNNRSIEEYLPEDAVAQLEESWRIKNDILQKENDMWNY
ncbi:Gliding motility associated protein GldN [Candidatus Ornithobacterium hominis]|uniref:type IX secretion system ring protein PorN/GldN n=1 Tax=Candidatus Ornithobacterium hominis TaxID=2497989 RepID=UPI0024BCC468|nr:gliding motility protein GldN [Candidatus Ornithobacterium hominis]CAI9429100.1 Gliding motility associated protein GldN [Candidatus Ornithobacterium hominis]